MHPDSVRSSILLTYLYQIALHIFSEDSHSAHKESNHDSWIAPERNGVGWVFSDEKLVSNCDAGDVTFEVLYKITDMAFDVSNFSPTIL